MTVRELAFAPVPWLEEAGPRGDVVLSSRVRLARNLEGRPFPHAAGLDEAAGVLAQIQAAVQAASTAAPGVAEWNLEFLSVWERHILLERSLASSRLLGGTGPRAVTVLPGGRAHLMVNEEDHLRIQTVEAGFQLEAALAAAIELDRALESRVPYATSSRHGYLTACPSNVGTGLRASVLLHVPGLVLSCEIKRVHAAVGEMGMVARGAFGEGSRALGDCVQLSNQRTLGLTEQDSVDALERVTNRVLELEMDARERLVEDLSRRRRLEDRVHRSRAILAQARMLTVDQALACASDVRFGKWLGRFDDVEEAALNRFPYFAQPAHLGRDDGKSPGPEDAQWRRARLAREWFAGARGQEGPETGR